MSVFLGGRSVDFALIDGLHLFEQALEDLCNLERYMAPGGIIAVHDTTPLNRETCARVRSSEFYSGVVWKIVVGVGPEQPRTSAGVRLFRNGIARNF